MAGYIAEFFGYQAQDNSEKALIAAEQKRCPFLKAQCTKILSRDRAISGKNRSGDMEIPQWFM